MIICKIIMCITSMHLSLDNAVFYYYIELYVKFDGLMHPQLNSDKLKQLQSKDEGLKPSVWGSVTGFFSKIKKYFIPSREGDTKYLPPFALRIYLSKHQDYLIGKVHTSRSPIEVITDITDVFNSLYETYLLIDNSCRLLPSRSDIQKVCIHSLFVVDCSNK